ncbi:SprT-like domain-containing protein, partial [Tsukamurella spumae]|uniref:SprT-like domain-containing protein n=1 Tax=Tsukamurella spumae TaxID=44753 RepID=UPI0031DC89B2
MRFCLECSKESGRLTQRTAPSLDRKRAPAAEAAAAKAKAQRARLAAAKQQAKQAEMERYTVDGTDLRDEFARLIRLRAFGVMQGRLTHNPPEFVITRRSKYPTRLGYAEPGRNRISLATYPGQTLGDALETLTHELTHIAVGHTAEEGWHGPTFRETLRKAFFEAYKVGPAGLPGNRYHGRYAKALIRPGVSGDSLCLLERGSNDG